MEKNNTSLKVTLLNESKEDIVCNVLNQLRNDKGGKLFIQGSPGMGKSDYVREICEQQGWGLCVKYLSNMAFEQLTGLPVVPKVGEVARFSKPDILSFYEGDMEYIPENYELGKSVTVLLLDDFHLSNRQYQQYCYQLFTYKRLQGYPIPKNTAIILAGNRMEDRANAQTIQSPICNRIRFFPVESRAEDWLKNYALKRGVRGDICTFINERGEMYLNSTPIESAPFATPRAWTYLSDEMNMFEETFHKLSMDDVAKMASGYLGPEIAAEFIQYRELFSKWHYSEMMKDDWKSVKSTIEREARENPTKVYGLINAGTTFLIENYRKCGDTADKNLKDVADFVYKVLNHILLMKVGKCNSRPLVVAGVQYLYKWQQAQSEKAIRSNNSLVTLLLQSMKQGRACDWVFYEVLSDIFNMPIGDDDRAKIEEAKKQLGVN